MTSSENYTPYPLIFRRPERGSRAIDHLNFQASNITPNKLKDGAQLIPTLVTDNKIKEMSLLTQHGNFDGRISSEEFASYAFMQNNGNQFILIPCTDWYTFTPAVVGDVMTTEEAEERVCLFI
ncbi:MAG: hypothetical protein EZS28_024351 [Streblomastix strix]|uniref:Uncharacterized protein n=1 Tax=Streblomastix strix TaxID=222440 RepID=A0A5J4VC74_9EUKA|nr:MAG: hypothetical protein EZS28_024351 [Streblomastix strix]